MYKIIYAYMQERFCEYMTYIYIYNICITCVYFVKGISCQSTWQKIAAAELHSHSEERWEELRKTLMGASVRACG